MSFVVHMPPTSSPLGRRPEAVPVANHCLKASSLHLCTNTCWRRCSRKLPPRRHSSIKRLEGTSTIFSRTTGRPTVGAEFCHPQFYAGVRHFDPFDDVDEREKYQTSLARRTLRGLITKTIRFQLPHDGRDAELAASMPSSRKGTKDQEPAFAALSGTCDEARD